MTRWLYKYFHVSATNLLHLQPIRTLLAVMQLKARCLTLLLLTSIVIEIDGRIRFSTSRALQKIQSTLTSSGKNVKARVDRVKNYLDSEGGSSSIEKVSSSIEKIGGAVSSVTSTDALQIVSGALDIISAATSLIPVVGPILSTVFSLISTIFGAVGGSEDIGSIVKKEIKKALDKYENSEIRAKVAGTVRIYSNSHAYLSRAEGEAQLTPNEVGALAANIPIYTGVEMLGILKSKVEEKAVSKNKDDVKRAAEYLKLYVTLAVLRSAVFWEMYSVVRATGHSDFTATGIKRVAEREERSDNEFLQFLETPRYSNAMFFAHFNPSEWPEIMKFMEKKSLSYQDLSSLENGEYTLSPKTWPNYRIMMYPGSEGVLGGTNRINDKSTKFMFDVISSTDNIFYMRSVKWPTWYTYMTDTKSGYLRGWGSKPGQQGEWKLIRFEDGRYMMSPRKWPGWFMYMKNDELGTIVSWEGDPGNQGHWDIA